MRLRLLLLRLRRRRADVRRGALRFEVDGDGRGLLERAEGRRHGLAADLLRPAVVVGVGRGGIHARRRVRAARLPRPEHGGRRQHRERVTEVERRRAVVGRDRLRDDARVGGRRASAASAARAAGGVRRGVALARREHRRRAHTHERAGADADGAARDARDTARAGVGVADVGGPALPNHKVRVALHRRRREQRVVADGVDGLAARHHLALTARERGAARDADLVRPLVRAAARVAHDAQRVRRAARRGRPGERGTPPH
mmetsp:Transcript_17925/g.55677  ORF Transcript_17925/g.55677 Transcript_17925/m.55677 type:complete len:259 (-) Transcript_17925:88-864(-)